MQLTALIIP